MNRLPQRRRRLQNARRPVPRGEWLTGLHYKRVRVWRKGLFGRREKDGYELTRPLLYIDYKGRLWVFMPGYVWDGPSYPSFLSWLIGDPNLEALLAASALHDAMGPDTLIFHFKPNEIETIRSITSHNSADLVRNMLHDLKGERINVSIVEGARIYSHAKRDWPNRDESIGYIKRRMQTVGLLMFQRKFRLISGGKHEQWKKVST